MMNFLSQNKVLVGIVITFLIGGLGAITGIVPAPVATIITLIISGLTAVGHGYNVSKGIR